MSSNDIKQLKKIVKDPIFKKQAAKLVDCSAKIITKKIKKLVKFSAKTLMSMLESDSDSDSDKFELESIESKESIESVPYPEVDINSYEEFQKWKNSSHQPSEKSLEKD